jgi:pilus assembly protein Flp/PilA
MSNKSRLRSIIALTCARFVADEQGATAIEYAMIAAGIGVVISATIVSLGSEIKTNFFDKIAALFS